MARKNILQGLMSPLETKSGTNPPSSSPQGDRAPKTTPSSSIGAVSQSIAELKARSVIEIDPHLIKAAGVEDRVEHDAEADAHLRHSLETYGQQVPILVRPHPETKGQYQIVYGRRRVLAARDLGITVRAMVRDLNDADLIMAQGQENTARRDLSFIEKVNFARQMREAGYKRHVICDALSIDKTEISRMLAIAERIPVEVIHAIGSAPGIGRPRWQQLAKLIEEKECEPQFLAAMATGKTGEERFDGVMQFLTAAERRAKAARAAEPPRDVMGADGTPIGKVRRQGRATVFELKPGAGDAGFADWLAEHMDEVHRMWRARTGGEG